MKKVICVHKRLLKNHSLSCQIIRATEAHRNLLYPAHTELNLTLFFWSMFLSHTQENWYHLTTHTILTGQIASSTCLNTAAATKAGRKPWLVLLEKQWRQMQRKARWKNTGRPDTGEKTGRDKVTAAEWWSERHVATGWKHARSQVNI